jgi:hypothetical protein
MVVRMNAEAALVRVVLAIVLGCLGAPAVAGQSPATVNTSQIGPQVGARVPPFSGSDQFGQSQSLDRVLGPKGAMLVFFRSADW